MSREESQFVDEFSNVHERGEELGRGGQGVVFRTRDPDVAIKLVLDGSGQPASQPGYAEKLRRVRSLPLPPRLNLSAPLATLQGAAGYAMRLLNEMISFGHLWPPSFRPEDAAADRPAWMASLPPEMAHQLCWYRDTGGLARRLVALSKCASVLARLHGAGLVYGDVSPANTFLSRDLSSREVWLIDGDNLCHETERGGRSVFTPKFGAPELVQGRDGCRPRTDCHAFAVMAFWSLTLLHPFIGAHVEEGGQGDWANDDAADLDEQAYAGLLPWILDANDDQNHKDNGLVDMVLTPELRSLFEETFGPGRVQPWRRPTMFAWPLALARAADEVITCPSCRMGYLVDVSDAAQSCPFCDHPRPRLLLAVAHDWAGQPVESEPASWQLAQLFAAGTRGPMLPHRLLLPFSLVDSDRDVLAVTEDGAEVRLRCEDASLQGRLAVAHCTGADDSFLRFEGEAALPLAALEAGVWLRVDGASPRVVCLRLCREVVR